MYHIHVYHEIHDRGFSKKRISLYVRCIGVKHIENLIDFTLIQRTYRQIRLFEKPLLAIHLWLISLQHANTILALNNVLRVRCGCLHWLSQISNSSPSHEILLSVKVTTPNIAVMTRRSQRNNRVLMVIKSFSTSIDK